MNGVYDYKQAVIDDIQSYIEENIDLDSYTNDRDSLIDKLLDECFVDDSVTGYASGSYYCNAYKAEEALCHNGQWYVEACRYFGINNYNSYADNPEAADVTIRCYFIMPSTVKRAIENAEMHKYLFDKEN